MCFVTRSIYDDTDIFLYCFDIEYLYNHYGMF